MSVASYTSELSYHEGAASIRSFATLRDENTTPLPKRQLFILSVITLTEPMDMVFLFPFVYFMVQSFGVAQNDDQVAFYVGILSSSFPASQFLTSFFWGYLSDRFGRRPILLIGVFGSTIAMICFGFSTSYWMALALRITAGLMNGIMGITKSIVGEITDETNRSGGFSVIGLVSGLGFVLGPMIGGFLADPAGNHPELFGDVDFFHKYPYCLPCLATGALSLFGAAVGFFFLEETLPSKRKVTADKEEKLSASEECQQESASTISSPTDSSLQPSAMATFSTLLKPIVIGSVLTYGIMSFATIMMDETFAIWAVAEPDHHGLEFTSSQVGVILTFSGIILLFTQMIIYPPLSRRLGPLGMYRLSILVSAPIFACFPTLTLVADNQQDEILSGGNAHFYHEIVLWVLLLLLVTIRTFLAVTCFTSSIIMISNCVTPDYLGAVNGLGQMTASGFRALGPFLAGSLWSWSIASKNSFPFNHYFVFLIAAAICVVGFILALFLPSSVNTPKKRTVFFDEEQDLLGGDPDVNTSIQSYESLLMKDSKSI